MTELPTYLVVLITFLFTCQWIYATASIFTAKDKIAGVIHTISSFFCGAITISLLVYTCS